MMVPDGLRIDLHSSCHASHKAHTVWYLIDVDAYRHALRKAHPGEDRIYRGEPCGVRLGVRDLDVTGDAADMATNELAVAHQFDGRRIACSQKIGTVDEPVGSSARQAYRARELGQRVAKVFRGFSIS
jgi:hypothetical protein